MEVTLSKFKNNIDHYLSEAQKGKELIIRHRKKVIARLSPPREIERVENEDLYDKEELELAAEGKLLLRKQLLPDSFFALPKLNVSADKLLEALLADRYEE